VTVNPKVPGAEPGRSTIKIKNNTMQEFFMPVNRIPASDQPDTTDLCIKIYLPHTCQHCSRSIIIDRIGAKDLQGITNNNTCNHFAWWAELWNNRIQKYSDLLEKVAAIKINNDINDGCKCNKCGLWYSMAAPNQLDNTFKCYSCRNRGW
jgi:hypothetical protein